MEISTGNTICGSRSHCELAALPHAGKEKMLLPLATGPGPLQGRYEPVLPFFFSLMEGGVKREEPFSKVFGVSQVVPGTSV